MVPDSKWQQSALGTIICISAPVTYEIPQKKPVPQSPLLVITFFSRFRISSNQMTVIQAVEFLGHNVTLDYLFIPRVTARLSNYQLCRQCFQIFEENP